MQITVKQQPPDDSDEEVELDVAMDDILFEKVSEPPATPESGSNHADRIRESLGHSQAAAAAPFAQPVAASTESAPAGMSPPLVPPEEHAELTAASSVYSSAFRTRSSVGYCSRGGF